VVLEQAAPEPAKHGAWKSAHRGYRLADGVQSR
jgi:hypothetical protein